MNNDSQIKGIPIIAIAPGSPSEQAGIKVGDLIVAVDNVAVNSLSDYIAQSSKRGKDMVVDVVRGNTFLTIVVGPNPEFMES